MPLGFDCRTNDEKAKDTIKKPIKKKPEITTVSIEEQIRAQYEVAINQLSLQNEALSLSIRHLNDYIEILIQKLRDKE